MQQILAPDRKCPAHGHQHPGIGQAGQTGLHALAAPLRTPMNTNEPMRKGDVLILVLTGLVWAIGLTWLLVRYPVTLWP